MLEQLNRLLVQLAKAIGLIGAIFLMIVVMIASWEFLQFVMESLS